MRPTRDLQDLQRAGLARIDRLNGYMSAVLVPLATSRPGSTDSAVAFVIIELDNLWMGIARSLFLSSAFCARDGMGDRIQLSKVTRAQNTNAALTYAIRSFRGMSYRGRSKGPWDWRDEPSWWNPQTLLKALDDIGASNYQQISVATSASPRALEHLHNFRNFYAHRGEGTRAVVVNDLRQLQFPTTLTATVALTSPMVDRGSVRPQALILDWLDDIRNTIELLV